VHYDGAIERSTISSVKVDPKEPVPLHEQVAAEIRRAIADGECGPGDRLPPAVDLAAVIGVNRNTVLRAMHVLREEGLLEFRRGRGVTVVGSAPRQSPVISMARELVRTARHHGYRRDELISLIESLP
jgi:GntR family transcriptional regulator